MSISAVGYNSPNECPRYDTKQFDGELLPREFSDGLSLGSKRQQVSLSLQEPSNYSGRSQGCSSLDGVDSSSDFQIFLISLQAFWTVPSAAITAGITVTVMFQNFLRFLTRRKYFSLFSLIFIFTQGQQSPQYGVFSSFLIIITKPGLLARIR